MIPLIDGDIIVYTISFVTENINDQEDVAKRTNHYILQILSRVGQEGQYNIFLTGKNNYRKLIYPDYKKSRRMKPKPRWYEFIRQHLIDKWNAITVNNIEADDALSITQRYYNKINKNTTIIASKDKDLLQIPGLHYRIPTKSTFPYTIVEIDETQAFQSLMQQSMMGDSTDDIPGIKGIGIVKSAKLISEVPVNQLFDKIIRKYIEVYGVSGPLIFWINYELVKLLETETEDFKIPPLSKIDIELINKYAEKYERLQKQ